MGLTLSIEKTTCKYGDECYRWNEEHNRICHNGKNPEERKNPPRERVKIPCRYGSNCWTKEKNHLKKYSHPADPYRH